jgi:hypothetical protein
VVSASSKTAITWRCTATNSFEWTSAGTVTRVVTVLPIDPDAKVAVLRSMLVRERGRIMSEVVPKSENERPPILQAPGSEHR